MGLLEGPVDSTQLVAGGSLPCSGVEGVGVLE